MKRFSLAILTLFVCASAQAASTGARYACGVIR